MNEFRVPNPLQGVGFRNVRSKEIRQEGIPAGAEYQSLTFISFFQTGDLKLLHLQQGLHDSLSL